MPYIHVSKRAELADKKPENVGELNYIISQYCINYLRESKLNYEAYNSVIGVLACVQQELYRRLVSKYEDECIAKHGRRILI